MKKDLWKAECRKDNPFKVPDGYFERFADSMMENLPAREITESSTANENLSTAKDETPGHRTVSLYTRVKPYLYLAATFCGLYFGIQVFKYQTARIQQERSEITAQNEQSRMSENDKYIEDFCNYVNVDHEDIYACVTSDYTN